MVEAGFRLIAYGLGDLKPMGPAIQAKDAHVPGRGFEQAGHQLQERCFTRASMPEQTNAFLALGHP